MENDTPAPEDAAAATPAPPAGTPVAAAVIYWAAAILACAALASWLWAEYRTPEAPGGYFVIVCLYALVGGAAISDAALRKISNRYNYPALIMAAVLMLVVAPLCELLDWREALLWIGCAATGTGGVAGEALKGFALCALVGVVSFAARGLGGGDVKLLAAAGLLAGWDLSAAMLLNTLAVSLVLGITNLAARGRLVRTVQEMLVRGYMLVADRNFTAPLAFRRNESPFCLSLLLGLALLPWFNARTAIAAWLR